MAVIVGFQVYKRQRQKALAAGAPELSTDQTFSVLVGMVVGAALGSKLVGFAYDPSLWTVKGGGLLLLTSGKSMVGGLLGATIGVELAKARAKIRGSTGDLFTKPVAIGLIIGRFGCLAAGLWDNTCGTATATPWGIDFGDGIPRHPTQIYEILFCAVMLLVLPHRPGWARRQGDSFRLFALGYFIFRLVVDALKDYPAVLGNLSATRVAAVLGILYYLPWVLKSLGGSSWSPKTRDRSPT